MAILIPRWERHTNAKFAGNAQLSSDFSGFLFESFIDDSGYSEITNTSGVSLADGILSTTGTGVYPVVDDDRFFVGSGDFTLVIKFRHTNNWNYIVYFPRSNRSLYVTNTALRWHPVLNVTNIATNNWYTLALTRNGNKFSASVNGTRFVTDLVNTWTDDNGGNEIEFFNGAGNSGYIKPCDIELVAIAREHFENIDELSENPYQILKPRQIWFPVTSGTGGPANYIISGSSTKTKIDNAGLDFTAASNNYTIAGNVVKSKIVTAALAYNQHSIIIGSISKSKIGNTALAYNQHNQISGAVSKTKLSSALLEYTQNLSITGQVTKAKLSSATLTFQSSSAYTITGNITKTKVSISNIVYNKHSQVSGNIAKTKTANATLSYASAGNYLIAGNNTKIKIINSDNEFNQHPALLGSVTKNKTTNAVTEYNQHISITGLVNKTKIIDSTLTFEEFIGQYTINGSGIKSKVSNANLRYTFTRTFTGNTIKTKSSEAVLSYVPITFVDWSLASLTLTAEPLLERTLTAEPLVKRTLQ